MRAVAPAEEEDIFEASLATLPVAKLFRVLTHVIAALRRGRSTGASSPSAASSPALGAGGGGSGGNDDDANVHKTFLVLAEVALRV